MRSAGNVLATKGEGFASLYAAETGLASAGGVALFIVNTRLMTPQQSHTDMATPISGWSLHIGLFASPADFIRRQAFVHLAVTGMAIAALLVLAYYLLYNLTVII